MCFQKMLFIVPAEIQRFEQLFWHTLTLELFRQHVVAQHLENLI